VRGDSPGRAGQEARSELHGLLQGLEEDAGALPVAGGEVGAACEGVVAAGRGGEAEEALGEQAREGSPPPSPCRTQHPWTTNIKGTSSRRWMERL